VHAFPPRSMHTSGRAGLRFYPAFHLRGIGTTADMRIGCLLPEGICQIRQISMCCCVYQAIGADVSVVSFGSSTDDLTVWPFLQHSVPARHPREIWSWPVPSQRMDLKIIVAGFL